MSIRFLPDLSLLDAYSPELEELEPFTVPFLAEFQSGGRTLYYIAAHHQAYVSSATFRLIGACFVHRAVRMVVLEGVPTEAGISPQTYLDDFKRERSRGFYANGEPAFAAVRAAEGDIPFLGGEPTRKEVCRHLRERGWSREDMIGQYFLRQLPTWRQNGILQRRGAKRLFEEHVPRFCAKAELTGLVANYEQFLGWYRQVSGTIFADSRLKLEDVGPLANGTYIQRISADEEVIRDRHLVTTLASTLNSFEAVMVVYGASHLACQRRVLSDMLGPPIHQVRKLT
jgi:hypothetical protein